MERKEFTTIIEHPKDLLEAKKQSLNQRIEAKKIK